MKSTTLTLSLLFLLARPAAAQNPEVKFIADTLVVQAEGTYEADPDLATLTFNISSQEKELRRAYETATQSMQRIVDWASRNGLTKDGISTGVLTVLPIYEGDRKQKARSYRVQGQVILRIRDFAKIGAIIDGSVQDGIADFRSLTYSLADEESAKQKAVGEAMKRAIGRATAALDQKGQKLGALRSATLDVKQLVGVARLEPYVPAEYRAYLMSPGASTTEARRGSGSGLGGYPAYSAAQPDKISVSASVQCVFQIQ